MYVCVFARKKTDAEKTEAGGWKKKKESCEASVYEPGKYIYSEKQGHSTALG